MFPSDLKLSALFFSRCSCETVYHQQAATSHDVLKFVYLLWSVRDCFNSSSMLFFFFLLLKGQRLVFCLNELLCKCLSERNPCDRKSPVTPCYHSWELNREASFFDMVIEVWQNILGMGTTEQATCAWQQLRSIEHPPSTSNAHPKQVNGFRSVYTLSFSMAYTVKGSHFVVVCQPFPGDWCLHPAAGWGYSLGEVDDRQLGLLA